MCRAFRYGQTRAVHVYRLIAAQTMEAKIYKRQVSKLGLGRTVVDDAATGRHFDTAELADLLDFGDDGGGESGAEDDDEGGAVGAGGGGGGGGGGGEEDEGKGGGREDVKEAPLIDAVDDPHMTNLDLSGQGGRDAHAREEAMHGPIKIPLHA